MSSSERCSASLPRARRQGGIALVELLVGLAVGMLVVVAATGSVLLSRGMASTVSELSQLHLQGAHALRVIGRQVRQAGARDIRANPATGRYAIADFSGFDAQGRIVVGTDGAPGQADQLSVSHQPASAMASTQRDCLGALVTSGHADSTFQVVGADLRCRTGTAAQPMTGNVADFQLRYRVTTPGGTRSLPATEVQAGGLWPAVSAIEVCLDLQSRRSDYGDLGSYRTCGRDADGSFASAPRAGRLHVVLRNVFDIRASEGAP